MNVTKQLNKVILPEGGMYVLPEEFMKGIKTEMDIYLVYKGIDTMMFLDGQHDLIGVFVTLKEAKDYIESIMAEYEKNIKIMDGRFDKIKELWSKFPSTKKEYDDGIMRPSDLGGLTPSEFEELTDVFRKLRMEIMGSYIINKTRTGVPFKEKRVYKVILDEHGKRED